MMPRCPNHAVEMIATDNPRDWICPVSRCHFEVEMAEDEIEVTYVNGEPQYTYKMRQLDGTGG